MGDKSWAEQQLIYVYDRGVAARRSCRKYRERLENNLCSGKMVFRIAVGANLRAIRDTQSTVFSAYLDPKIKPWREDYLYAYRAQGVTQGVLYCCEVAPIGPRCMNKAGRSSTSPFFFFLPSSLSF